jgi:RNA polymerase sigma-70 factor, ECF subfamily
LCCHASTGQIGNRHSATTAAVSDSLADLLPGMLRQLWVFSLRLTGDRHDAEDLVQAACARALEREHQLKPDTAPLSWMFSIMQSTWFNELRARKVRRRTSVDWDDSMMNIADPDAAPIDDVLYSREVIAAVERLPEAHRTVVLLVAVEGLSYAEAAQVLDVPVGTVMSRLSRARQSIGEKFGKSSEMDVQKAKCGIGKAR